MTSLSAKAQRARAHLLRQYNALDVFVEDSSCQQMYVRVINHLLGGKGRVTAVYPLGSRDEVVRACASDQAAGGRPRLYLIDGDLDLLLGRRVPRLKHLYRLRVYCVENLLLSEPAFVEIALEGRANDTVDQVRGDLGVQALIENLGRAFLPLFVVYAVVLGLGLPIETVGVSVFRLLGDPDDPDSVSAARVRARIRAVVREVLAHANWRAYKRARRRVSRRLRRAASPEWHLVSGKDYLLPLLQKRLHSVGRVRYTSGALKARLALHFDGRGEPTLRRRLIRAVTDRTRAP